MIKTISRDQLMAFKNTDTPFKLVDVRVAEGYAKEHIAGAISIPLAEIEKEAFNRLKKSDTIVVYCGSYACTASTMAAEKLLALGYGQVLDFKGGLIEYKEAGLPLECCWEGAAKDCPACCDCDEAFVRGGE